MRSSRKIVAMLLAISLLTATGCRSMSAIPTDLAAREQRQAAAIAAAKHSANRPSHALASTSTFATTPSYTPKALPVAPTPGRTIGSIPPQHTAGIAAVNSPPAISPAASAHSVPASPISLAQFQAPATPPPTNNLSALLASEPSKLQQEFSPNQAIIPIDFSTVLGWTADQNPRIAFAQAQVSQAYAQHQAARVMWLPHIRAGMNFNKHDGRLQDVEGNNLEISRGAAYAGVGANAVGAGSPAIPGIYVNLHTTDAIFQRRITNHRWQANSAQSDAARNDQLLETALAYLALLEGAQRQAIARQTLTHGEELAKVTANFARAGAGNQADADRAQAVLAVLRTETLRAEEAFVVASARLAQLTSADPHVRLVPAEPNIVPIDLVACSRGETSQLVALGLAQRPELSASRALVCEAVNRLERERFAPWLPSVLLGTSYGSFAAGTGSNITNGADRFDFDAAAWWEIRNFGAGERAARDQASAQIEQAKMREVEAMDLVAREIVEAATQVQSRRQQMAVAQAGIQAAQQSYARNRERIQNAQGLPIEVLQAIQALDQAQREYLRTVVDYNSAQFRLHRALGCPIGNNG